MTHSTNQHQNEQPLFVDRQGNPVKLEFPESTDPKKIISARSGAEIIGIMKIRHAPDESLK